MGKPSAKLMCHLPRRVVHSLALLSVPCGEICLRWRLGTPQERWGSKSRGFTPSSSLSRPSYPAACTGAIGGIPGCPAGIYSLAGRIHTKDQHRIWLGVSGRRSGLWSQRVAWVQFPLGQLMLGSCLSFSETQMLHHKMG